MGTVQLCYNVKSLRHWLLTVNYGWKLWFPGGGRVLEDISLQAQKPSSASLGRGGLR